MHNIEKSAFRKGAYVGYGAGQVWHITKSNSSYGRWVARCDNIFAPSLFAWRLRDLVPMLENAKLGGPQVQTSGVPMRNMRDFDRL